MTRRIPFWPALTVAFAFGCAGSKATPQARESWPSSVHVAAVVAARGFSIVPYSDGDSIVVPLPPDRERFVRVDLSVRVVERGTGKVVDTQHAVFSRYTEGDSLRFYLPELAGDAFDVEIQSVSYVDSSDASGTVSVVRAEDSAFLTIKGAESAVTVTTTAKVVDKEISPVVFHFKRDSDQLTDEDTAKLSSLVDGLAYLLKTRKIGRAQADCWASTEGDEQRNWALSRRRCAWVQQQVWQKVPDPKPRLEAAPHGANNLPYREPGEDDPASEDARKKNRVAVVRLWTQE